MDVSPVMPLDQEILGSWHGWLAKHYEPLNPQLSRLKDFLNRVKAGKRFCDLDWREKDELRGIVGRMVEAEP